MTEFNGHYAIFNLDGTISRRRRKACPSCGAMEECDACWEHVCDWSPFVVLHCFVCQMPHATFDGGLSPLHCEFCGAHEEEFTTTSIPT